MTQPEPVKMKCPFCESTVFLRKSTEEIHMLDDGESITDVLADKCHAEYTYECAGCHRDVTEVELTH